MANGKRMKPVSSMNQAPHGGKGTIQIIQPPRTSRRCRATHDVPWTERCVLDELHPLNVQDGVVMHKDKRGEWWSEFVS